MCGVKQNLCKFYVVRNTFKFDTTYVHLQTGTFRLSLPFQDMIGFPLEPHCFCLRNMSLKTV